MATGELSGRRTADDGDTETSTPPSHDREGGETAPGTPLRGALESDGAAEGQAVRASMCGWGGSSAPRPTKPPASGA